MEAGPGGEEQVVVSHFALGTWSDNQRARRAKLTPGQLAQLAEPGCSGRGGVVRPRAPSADPASSRGRLLRRRDPEAAAAWFTALVHLNPDDNVGARFIAPDGPRDSRF